MQLPPEDVAQFFRINKALMCVVNQRLKVTDDPPATPEVYAHLPPAARLKVHEALPGHLELIHDFVAENPFHLDEADLEIVRSWKHLVFGTFYAFRRLQKYMVFLSSTEPAVAYGVLALSDRFEVLLGPHLPQMLRTTLLPFKGRIIYDGLISAYNVIIGPGIRRSLNENFKEAKERFGIITSLPPSGIERSRAARARAARKESKAPGAPRGGSSTRAASRAAHDRIVALTDAFCRDYLDDEYSDLCRKMAGVLARKRPSPLTRGKPESWASGIIRAIGFVNFLGDPSQPQHMRMTDIDERLGVSEATGAAKWATIRDLLKIGRFDPEWTLPSKVDDNPYIWLLTVNGFPVDIRVCPREAQEAAYAKGLIPYIPADREPKGTRD
jgi:hypothetical protein